MLTLPLLTIKSVQKNIVEPQGYIPISVYVQNKYLIETFPRHGLHYTENLRGICVNLCIPKNGSSGNFSGVTYHKDISLNLCIPKIN